MAIERIPITSREQWLELRRQDVTASAVGAIFGCHPFQTIAGLHAEKSGLDLPGPDPESAVIRRGNALEGVAAAEVAKLRSDWTLIKNNDYYRDPRAQIGATPDFLIVGDPRGRGVLQTKTVASSAFKRLWGTADEPSPPLWIVLQTITEMMLADAAFGAVGVLIIGDFAFDAHVIEVPRHKPTEHKIRVAVHAFWEAIRIGQVPELDYSRDGDLIRAMYRATEPGKVIDLRSDNRIVELLENRQRHAEDEKAAKKSKEEAEGEIRHKLGAAEVALVPGWSVTNKKQTRKERIVPASTFRVLRTREEKSDVGAKHEELDEPA
jgi:predicted phage-related endonuclease